MQHPLHPPSRSSSTKTALSTNKSVESSSESDDGLSGYLWKQEQSSRGRMYWIKRFYVVVPVAGSNSTDDDQLIPFVSTFLHQYDNEQQARGRAQAATKKNRIPITPQGCNVESPDSNAIESSSAKYEFVVSVLGGRVSWHLAASTKEDRSRWMEYLQQVASTPHSPTATG